MGVLCFPSIHLKNPPYCGASKNIGSSSFGNVWILSKIRDNSVIRFPISITLSVVDGFPMYIVWTLEALLADSNFLWLSSMCVYSKYILGKR